MYHMDVHENETQTYDFKQKYCVLLTFYFFRFTAVWLLTCVFIVCNVQIRVRNKQLTAAPNIFRKHFTALFYSAFSSDFLLPNTII